MTPSQTYTIKDPVALAAKIKAAGGPAIDPIQPTGKATADGVTVMWTIVPGENGADSIMVTILSKPWLISYATIWEHIGSVLS